MSYSESELVILKFIVMLNGSKYLGVLYDNCLLSKYSGQTIDIAQESREFPPNIKIFLRPVTCKFLTQSKQNRRTDYLFQLLLLLLVFATAAAFGISSRIQSSMSIDKVLVPSFPKQNWSLYRKSLSHGQQQNP